MQNPEEEQKKFKQIKIWFLDSDLDRIKAAAKSEGVQHMSVWIEQAIEDRLKNGDDKSFEVPAGNQRLRISLSSNLINSIEEKKGERDLKVWIKEAVYLKL